MILCESHFCSVPLFRLRPSGSCNCRFVKFAFRNTIVILLWLLRLKLKELVLQCKLIKWCQLSWSVTSQNNSSIEKFTDFVVIYLNVNPGLTDYWTLNNV